MEHDIVNHPAHYTAGGIETIDYIKEKTTPEGFEGHLVGCILKYISRYKFKNGIEDLKKCRWYLDKLIGFLEERSDSWSDIID